MKTYAKFGLLVVGIIGTLAWLAAGGVSESKSYYKEIKELNAMGERAHRERLKVGGDVEKGSIQRSGAEVTFTLVQQDLKMKVVYAGSDPLPDTFRDGSQALVDGKLAQDGVFHASKIQAKCASKYEAKPGQVGAPVNNSRASM